MPIFPVEIHELARFLTKRRIVTMEELKQCCGTTAERTIFRKLKQLSYCTSYTHGGRFFGSIRISQADFRRIDGTLGRLGALARLWPLSTVRRGTGVALTKVTRRCCGQHARAVTARLSIGYGFAG